MILLLFIASLLAAAQAEPPKPPALTFLYTVNITFPAPVVISPTREAIPLTGGSFAGPRLNGKHCPPLSPSSGFTGPSCRDSLANAPQGTVLPIGADFFGMDAQGNASPAPAYVLQTADGVNILVRGAGHSPVEHNWFETGSGKYGWLNDVVGVASGTLVPGGVSLNVWQVS